MGVALWVKMLRREAKNEAMVEEKVQKNNQAKA